jgi:DNA repair protein RecO (recombination protein O)
VTARVYKDYAIVLRRRNLGETDRVVTFFGRDRGKFEAVAKGARRPKSKLAGSTEPFRTVKLMCALGRTLDIVSQCETQRPFNRIRADLPKIAAASMVAELCDGLLPEHQPNPALFDLAETGLDLIDESGDAERIALSFVLHAARMLGYDPVLGACASCGRAIDERAAFSPSAGGVVCPACGAVARDIVALSPPALEAMRKLKAARLENGASIEIRRADLEQINRVLKRFCEDKMHAAFRSPDFYSAVARLGKTGAEGR